MGVDYDDVCVARDYIAFPKYLKLWFFGSRNCGQYRCKRWAFAMGPDEQYVREFRSGRRVFDDKIEMMLDPFVKSREIHVESFTKTWM